MIKLVFNNPAVLEVAGLINKTVMANFLKEYRCKRCNKLFFKGDLRDCVVEIKCKNCKNISRIEVEIDKNQEN